MGNSAATSRSPAKVAAEDGDHVEPPPPEMQQILGAVHGNQDAMDGFARVNAGVTSPAEYFSEENLGQIFAAAH